MRLRFKRTSHQFRQFGTTGNIMGYFCCSLDRNFQNVILLSVSFMLLFTSFQTMGNIEQTVLDSIKQDDKSFEGDGYTSLAIIYAVFAISNWIAPSIVAVLHAKLTMLLGGVIYTGFIASFLYPQTWLLYFMSVVLGFGAAIIWTAQGNYLTLSSSSNKSNMARNSGVFWAIFQTSMFIGNSFVFYVFEGKTQIDSYTRQLVFTILTAVACIGLISLCFLRAPEPETSLYSNIQDQDQEGGSSQSHINENEEMIRSSNPPPIETNSSNALGEIAKSFQLFVKKDMILLSWIFFYTGISLSFFSGVYGSSVGFTLELKESKRLVGLCGILIGIGEVLGGAIFGILGSRTVKFGRDPVILLGFLSHTAAYYLIFINLPNNSPFGPTNTSGYLESPSASIAMLCAFLLGFGDSCFNTQLYGILGSLFSKESAPAFALFKFTQSSAAAISFFYSSTLTLHIQLLILQIFCILGSVTFFLVEWRNRNPPPAQNQSLLESDDEDTDREGNISNEQANSNE